MKRLLFTALLLATPVLAQTEPYRNLHGKTLCLGTHLVQFDDNTDDATTQNSLNATLTNLLTTKFTAYRIKTLPGSTATCTTNPNALVVNLIVDISGTAGDTPRIYLMKLRVADFSGKRYPGTVTVWDKEAYGYQGDVAATISALTTYAQSLTDLFASEWARANP